MSRVIAPWPILVLDSGGLSAAAANSDNARAALAATEAAGAPVLLPSIVVAEATAASPREAMLNKVIQGTTVVPLDLDIAREAASLKMDANMSGVEHTIDAIVVATAVHFGGGAILTSDPKDISTLADQRHALRIRTLTV